MAEIVPLENIIKIEQVVDFYTKMLDFQIVESHSGTDGKLDHAIVSRGSHRIEFARKGDYAHYPQIDEMLPDFTLDKSRVYMIVDDKFSIS